MIFDTVTGRPRVTNRTRWLIAAVSVVVHAVILAALVIAALTTLTMPPVPDSIVAFVAPDPFDSVPPPPPPLARTSRPRARPAVPDTRQFVAPLEMPSAITPEPAVAGPAAAGVLGGVEGGVPGGVVGGVVGGQLSSLPPPPPPRPPAPPAPVRIGGAIKAPALETRVTPEYPAIARAAHLEGLVVLEASVDERGRVDSVKVLRSAGLLDRAAVDAVKQWRYAPLTLNGRPTPFVLTVTLQFHFQNGMSVTGDLQ